MAYSSSIKRAQAIKLCELCQEESIKWRCIDCDMCLCEKCKTFHLRVPATAQHQIVTIGTPIQEVPKRIVTDNIPCKDHPKKMTCLFCRSCDSLICPDCASSTHKKHEFDSVESALGEKLNNLGDIKDKINEKLQYCDSKISEVKTVRPKYNAIFDESLTKIKLKEQELIDAIRNHSKHLQETVEDDRRQANNTLSKIEQDVTNRKKNLQDKNDKIDAFLASNQGGVIFRADIKIEDLKFDSFPKQVDQFVPSTESTTKIQEIFGSLQRMTISTSHDLPKIRLEVTETFTTDLPHINKVVTLDQTSAWISCFSDKVLRKVKVNENSLTTSQELSMSVCDMAITSNNELLLCIKGKQDIQLLKASGKIESLFTVAPLFPSAIHTTENDDVLVGVIESGDLYSPTKQSQRAIVVYSIDGKKKHKYQQDNLGKRLFTNPKRVMTNNQHILVIDKTSSTTKRVVTLDKEGNVKWVYKGHNEINASKKFDPRGIVTTTVGHIVVSDCGSNAIHVLSEDGKVLTCKVMRDMGIIYPWGLDIDNEGRLWVGCGTGGEETGAKLHIIKLSP